MNNNSRQVKMVSRRKILSRSRDDLSSDMMLGMGGGQNGYYREEEDVWYLKEKLYKVSEDLKWFSYEGK